ncbi:MAG: thioredoxin-like domain-containing protein, partial [Polyangiaceae bacterium]
MKIAKHALLLLLASIVACNTTKTQARAPSDDGASAAMTTSADEKGLPPDNERVAVPGFDGATSWLNVDHALTLKELAGHVVVVDFWTSCCINCLQTLPTLSAVEDEHSNDGVVVVGVHSPKFDAETE